jgi:hypothetical protein
MADSITRIVPSSVGVERVSRQEKEPQKRKRKELPSRPATTDQSAEADVKIGPEQPSTEDSTDKGKHLDIKA